MPAKRKISDEEDQLESVEDPSTGEVHHPSGLVSASADLATGTPRRKIKAGSGKLSEVALASPGSTGTATEIQGRLRKKHRLEKYYEEMAVLNRSFVSYCKDMKQVICRKLENNEKILPEEEDLTEPAREYIQHAEKIKRRWIPTTGDVLSFGTNEFGQLAQSDNVSERKRPCLVTTLRNRCVVEVAGGGLNNVVATEDGKVYTWGCNDDGTLGNLMAGDTSYTPVHVWGFVPSARETAVGLQRPKYTWSDLKGSRSSYDFTDPTLELDHKYEEMIVSVAVGDTHCLALSITGRVYFFGALKCKEGMCWSDIPPEDDPRIHPEESMRKSVPPAGKREWPIHVWQLGGEAIQIACTYSMCAAVVKRTVNGIQKQECFTWGLGESGEIARPVFRPIKKSDEEVQKIPKEELSENGYLKFYVDKVRDEYMKPGPALFADGNQDRIVEAVACGGYHILVLARDSEDSPCELYSAGLNNYHQLGPHDGDSNSDDDVPKNKDRLCKVVSFNGIEIKKIAAGEQFSLCLDSTGKNLYGFGRSCSCQLGYSETAPPAGSFVKEPVPIYLEYNSDGTPKENPVIVDISCGGSHSFALTEDGDVYSWGFGPSGALGIGNISDGDTVSRPVKVDVTNGINRIREKRGELPLSAKVQMVAGGGQHSIMLATLH